MFRILRATPERFDASLLKAGIRTTAYPVIAGGAALLLIQFAMSGVSYWPYFRLVVAVRITLVALLERVAPYEPDWNRDHDGDTFNDAIYQGDGATRHDVVDQRPMRY